jgi:nitroimidazol reductase NimA-like FMN-containing flavoprotein (pyridoxamine 5'-phosphate oxidase superfamily)
MRLLRENHVGRIAVVIDGFPEVLPVNYRLVETSGVTWIALGTRRGHVIARASMQVAFEIDEVEPTCPATWSVLVRGTLHHIDEEAADFRQRFDPDPWPGAERDVWLAVQPFAISGRRLTTAGTVAA